jgi:hypothetical protein
MVTCACILARFFVVCYLSNDRDNFAWTQWCGLVSELMSYKQVGNVSLAFGKRTLFSGVLVNLYVLYKTPYLLTYIHTDIIHGCLLWAE